MKYLRMGLLAFCALMAASLTQASPNEISFARNLHADAKIAQRAGIPILIIFTSPDCSYCELVMKNYLIPMQNNPNYAQKVLFRRVEIDRDSALTDFDGKVTTPQRYAARYKIRLTPTIIVFTPSGEPAGAPLVGLGPEDYYGGNLDAAIDAGLEKMRAVVH